MPTDTKTLALPSRKQLSYLKSLADQRGESFTYPTTAAQASAEIDRLLSRRRSTTAERRIERKQISEDMSRPQGAAVRGFEVVGYGSSAHWAGG